MSVEQKRLRCVVCGNEWIGLWDMGSDLQTPAVKECPKCGSLTARPRFTGLFSDNAFDVHPVDDGHVVCTVPGVRSDGQRELVTVTLPRDYSLNLAAWLARCADAEEDFFVLYGRLKGR